MALELLGIFLRTLTRHWCSCLTWIIERTLDYFHVFVVSRM